MDNIKSFGLPPEFYEVIEAARPIISPEDEHRVLVDASNVTEPLVRSVAQSLHLHRSTGYSLVHWKELLVFLVHGTEATYTFFPRR